MDNTPPDLNLKDYPKLDIQEFGTTLRREGNMRRAVCNLHFLSKGLGQPNINVQMTLHYNDANDMGFNGRDQTIRVAIEHLKSLLE